MTAREFLRLRWIERKQNQPFMTVAELGLPLIEAPWTPRTAPATAGGDGLSPPSSPASFLE